MKNIIEFIKTLPNEIYDVFLFVFAVLLGTGYKVAKQNEKGMKITFRKMLTEGSMSFFIALIVFAVFDQFLNFNKLFTYMMCSLAGSMSSLFHSKLEDLLNYLFEAAKKKINQLLKIQ